MIERPCELLHMDIVGPSRVRSAGGKWYVLVIVDDFSHYSWVFFLARKDEVFMHFWSLALRLFKEQEGALRAIRSDNGTEFKNASFDAFCRDHALSISSQLLESLNRMALLRGRTGRLLRWLGRC